MPRRQMPSSGDMRGAPPCLGNHLTRYEKPELDPNTGEPDAFAARLGAGRHVMVAGQLPALHAPAVVDNRQRRASSVGQHADAARTRVERVRDHFGEDRLFKGAPHIRRLDAGSVEGTTSALQYRAEIISVFPGVLS